MSRIGCFPSSHIAEDLEKKIAKKHIGMVFFCLLFLTTTFFCLNMITKKKKIKAIDFLNKEKSTRSPPPLLVLLIFCTRMDFIYFDMDLLMTPNYFFF
jgi:hypothetical protein